MPEDGMTVDHAEDDARLEVLVPEGVVPGDTKLRVKVDVDTSIIVPVPQEATPGRDHIVISKDADGSWQAALLLQGDEDIPKAARAPHDEGLSPAGRQLRMTTLTMGVAAHTRAIEQTLAAGAFISPKIERGELPPLCIPGLIATAPIEQGEVVCKVPAALHISEETCRQHMRPLFEAVMACNEIVEGRRIEQAHTACLAALLGEVRMEATTEEAVPMSWLDRVPFHWRACAQVMMSVPFDFHPWCRWLTEREQMQAVLSPSNEFDHIEPMLGDLLSMYAVIERQISPSLLGPGFDRGSFMKARLCCLTRQFGTPRGSSIVPVVDLFNHSDKYGVQTEWDVHESALVFKAKRRHEAGEELFISYGEDKSNALLFRTYGFTLPSQVEPAWTFSCTTGDLQDVLQRRAGGSSPSSASKWSRASEVLAQNLHPIVELDFHSANVPDITKSALEACVVGGVDVVIEAFLDLLKQKARLFEDDPALEARLGALAVARQKDPKNAEWWAQLPIDEERDAHAEEALRVKMGEYLCITSHIEALQVYAGHLAEERSLERASKLRVELVTSLDLLKDGQKLPRST